MACYNTTGLDALRSSGYDGELWAIGVDLWEKGESSPYDGYSLLFYDDEREADAAMGSYATQSGIAGLVGMFGLNVAVGDTVQLLYEYGEMYDGDVSMEKTDWQEYFEKQQDGLYRKC